MSDDPVVETKPVVEPKPAEPLFPLIKEPAPVTTEPLVGSKPALNPAMANPAKANAVDGPTVPGEGAQRFVNKNAVHSERVLQGKIVTPPVRKERYEHPERKA